MRSGKAVGEDVFGCVFESIHPVSAIQAPDAKGKFLNNLQEFCTPRTTRSDKFPQALDSFWDDSTTNKWFGKTILSLKRILGDNFFSSYLRIFYLPWSLLTHACLERWRREMSLDLGINLCLASARWRVSCDICMVVLWMCCHIWLHKAELPRAGRAGVMLLQHPWALWAGDRRGQSSHTHTHTLSSCRAQSRQLSLCLCQ